MNKNNASRPIEQCMTEARQLIGEEKYVEALHAVRRGLCIDASRPELYNLHGIVEELRGDKDAARKMYRVALSLEPGYHPAVENLHRVCMAFYRLEGINYGDRLVESVTAASFAL